MSLSRTIAVMVDESWNVTSLGIKMATGTTFFDAHSHLQDARYLGADACVLARAAGGAGSASDDATSKPIPTYLDCVMQRTRRAGVSTVAVCGTSPADWEAVLSLCQRGARTKSGGTAGEAAGRSDEDCDELPVLLPSVGVHPWWTGELPSDWLTRLRELLVANPTAGVGEIGLDRSRRAATTGAADNARQREVFVEQLRLAKELSRPASIHCVAAHGAMLDICVAEGPFPAGILLHSYSGSAELVNPLAAVGAYFSFSAAVLSTKNAKIHRAVATVPGDRLLIETDSPDQVPHGSGEGVLNEPVTVIKVAKAVADIRETSIEDVAKTTRENAARLLVLA